MTLACLLALAGCVSEPVEKQERAPESRVEAPPAPPPPPPVVLSPEQARSLTRDALEPLQAGDEVTARALLEQAQKLDPAYDLPRRLLQQIASDPQREHGATSFPYRVERGDSLASIAQRFLNDRYLFYALARYNDIKVPKNLHVGQTIRIWGKAPKVAPPKAQGLVDLSRPEPVKVAPPKPQSAAEAARPEPPKPIEAPVVAEAPKPKATDPARLEADRYVAQGQQQQKAGSLEAAVRSYDTANRRDPTHPEAARLAAAARKEHAGALHKEATAEFSKQNLCRAIALWDRTIELDPEQRLAMAKRAQALDLRDKLCKIDETRCCALEGRR
jgi:tetratricopeptide (TPR) repeat protein